VIGKVCQRGGDVGRLLAYLFREGLAGERGLSSPHTAPRLVGAWDGTAGLEPALTASGGRDVRALASALNAPLLLAGLDRAEWKTARAVYHLALSAADTDRTLTDDQWAQIAAEFLDRIGIAPRGDEAAVRWVAVRHADDHVHVVATLARQDGRRVWPRNDFYRAREACLAVERRLGLRATSPADRTGPRETTRPELRRHQADQQRAAQAGLPPPPGPARVVLRRRVRAAAASADDLQGFLGHLERDGTMVRLRYSQRDPEQVTGYAVALPGRGDDAGGPVWFGGGKLAPDLTLPQLQARWIGGPGARAGSGQSPLRETGTRAPKLTAEQRAAIFAEVGAALHEATEHLYAGGGGADDVAWAAGDAVAAFARITDGRRRAGPTTLAAEAFERAARPARRAVPNSSVPSRRLRTASTALGALRVVLPSETRRLHTLLGQLDALVRAVGRLREVQGRAAQAAAARAAAEHLDTVLHAQQPARPAAAATPQLLFPTAARATAPPRGAPGRAR